MHSRVVRWCVHVRHDRLATISASVWSSISQAWCFQKTKIFDVNFVTELRLNISFLGPSILIQRVCDSLPCVPSFRRVRRLDSHLLDTEDPGNPNMSSIAALIPFSRLKHIPVRLSEPDNDEYNLSAVLLTLYLLICHFHIFLPLCIRKLRCDFQHLRLQGLLHDKRVRPSSRLALIDIIGTMSLASHLCHEGKRTEPCTQNPDPL